MYEWKAKYQEQLLFCTGSFYSHNVTCIVSYLKHKGKETMCLGLMWLKISYKWFFFIWISKTSWCDAELCSHFSFLLLIWPLGKKTAHHCVKTVAEFWCSWSERLVFDSTTQEIKSFCPSSNGMISDYSCRFTDITLTRMHRCTSWGLHIIYLCIIFVDPECRGTFINLNDIKCEESEDTCKQACFNTCIYREQLETCTLTHYPLFCLALLSFWMGKGQK